MENEIKLDTSYLFQYINFEIPKYDKCEINQVKMRNKDNDIVDIPPNILKLIGYPKATICIRYDIEPTGSLQYPKIYNQKKGYFTIKDIIVKIFDFYNKSHSKDEINRIYELTKLDIDQSKPRRFFIKKRSFNGFAFIDEEDTFDLNMV